MTHEEREAIKDKYIPRLESYGKIQHDLGGVWNDLMRLLTALDAAEKRAEYAEVAAIKILMRFREKCGWCRDYKDCKYDRDWGACNKLDFETTLAQVEENDKLLDQLDADRDRLRKRCEALERAIIGICPLCVNVRSLNKCFVSDEVMVCKNWKLDESRFAEKV